MEKDLANPIGETLSAQHFLEKELTSSHGPYDKWSRQVIAAIGKDDALALKDVYTKYRSLGADVNQQVDEYGYGGYLWTIWNHQFIGDSALHICIKQKKVHCICQLLLMPDTSLVVGNDQNETADDLAMKIFDQSIYSIQKEARRILFELLDPRNFHRLPYSHQYLDLKYEAWKLMESGRCLYTEVPASFDRKLDNSGRLNDWIIEYSKCKGPYMRNRYNNKLRNLTSKEKHWLNSKWKESRDGSGWKIYVNEVCIPYFIDLGSL
jgi:hypothetical protein